MIKSLLSQANSIIIQGHTFFPDPLQAAVNASGWALTSPGNVNWALLQDFAARGLDDMAHIGKAVTQSFYGKAPKYSYWNGCSTGGRQGLIQAQRYPKNYDGILAAAPAINWASFLVAEQWGQVLMRKENYFPPKCESDAITRLAIESCDELDGVKVRFSTLSRGQRVTNLSKLIGRCDIKHRPLHL